MSHTPGPWEHRKAGSAIQGEPGHEEKFEYPDHVVSVVTDDQKRRVTRFVAECSSTTLDNRANARLIAAAPDLLDAAKFFAKCMAHGAKSRGLSDSLKLAHAAITKALRETPPVPPKHAGAADEDKE